LKDSSRTLHDSSRTPRVSCPLSPSSSRTSYGSSPLTQGSGLRCPMTAAIQRSFSRS
jgi:hypothetical protein